MFIMFTFLQLLSLTLLMGLASGTPTPVDHMLDDALVSRTRTLSRRADAPYATGTCTLLLKISNDMNRPHRSHTFEMTIWDHSSAQIGYLPQTSYADGTGISVDSKLEDSLIVVEDVNYNFFTFELGQQQWASTPGMGDNPGCTLRNWGKDAAPNVCFTIPIMFKRETLIIVTSRCAKSNAPLFVVTTVANLLMDHNRVRISKYTQDSGGRTLHPRLQPLTRASFLFV